MLICVSFAVPLAAPPEPQPNAIPKHTNAQSTATTRRATEDFIINAWAIRGRTD
jgi:hypothetical protein